MKILRKIAISLLVGLVMYLGYASVFASNPDTILIPSGIAYALIPVGASFIALLINELVDVIKKK